MVETDQQESRASLNLPKIKILRPSEIVSDRNNAAV